jgi:GrpB-like predicted nucleotidyltransferase (UPF0157 family)
MVAYLYPYNPQWHHRYLNEAEVIKQASVIDLDLYHIGSTAIKGMYAKDCIDILGVISSFNEGKKIIKHLESLDYEYRGEYGVKGRHYFSKNQPNKFHLHIFTQSSEEIIKHLHYVNVMSKSPKLVEEFNIIKQKIFKLHPTDKTKYQQQKSSFYEKVANNI